jgi:hypothetical protein
MCARTRRSTLLVVTVVALGVAAPLWSWSRTGAEQAAAAPTTTVAATTSTTRPAPTTTAVTTTTEAGPPPRSSQRVAAAVDAEKIRPTTLPWRTMAIATAVVIAGLAIAGFVYGKVRSRTPAVATTRQVTVPPSEQPAQDPTPAGTAPLTAPPPTPLPPPRVTPLPQPESVNEWAPPKP